MGKTFIVLEEEDLVLIERVCIDQNPRDALDFVLHKVVPQITKRSPCFVGRLRLRHKDQL